MTNMSISLNDQEHNRQFGSLRLQTFEEKYHHQYTLKENVCLFHPPAQIVRRYSMCYIPPGFWPRLVARLIAFPKRALQIHRDQVILQCIRVTLLHEYIQRSHDSVVDLLVKSCDSLGCRMILMELHDDVCM